MDTEYLSHAARRFGVPLDQFILFLERASRDPAFWIESISGQKLWEKQKEICQSFTFNRMTCVPACNASGKTHVLGGLVAYGISNMRPYLAITTAPTERQVKHALWKEIRDFHGKARIPLPGKPDLLQWIVSDNQRALGFATSDYNPNLFQGIREANGTRLMFDEACGITAPVFEGGMGIMAAGDSRMVQAGNPVDPLTQFREDCESPYSNTIRISAYDTPNFNIPGHELREKNFTCSEAHPDWWETVLTSQHSSNLPAPYLTTPTFVQDIIRTYGVTSPQYVSRVLGLFPEQSEEALFGLQEIEDAQKPPTPDQLAKAQNSPLEIGVDVARFGSNLTVIMGWQDPLLRVLDVFSKKDTFQTAERVRAVALRCVRHGLPPLAVKVDVIGVGGGVVDMLQHQPVDWGRGSQQFPVVAYNAASTENIPSHCQNARGHGYLHLKKLLEARDISLPTAQTQHAAQLRKELLSIRKANPDTSEKTIIAGKEWMRKQGLPSPDFADAAVIAVYPGIRPRGDYGVTV